MLMLPCVVYFIVFCYTPMYGVLIAFKSFKINLGILGSPWVGLQWFNEFINSMFFFRLIRNTLMISFYSLLFGFPAPILFALTLNELKDGLLKRGVQTICYFPHFISTVIVVGILFMFLSPTDGIINITLQRFGFSTHNFMQDAKWFRTIYIGSGIWQGFGWGSIIYMGAISGIDPQLYDAATIDGAGRLQKIKYLTFPSIKPVIVTLLILNIGSLFSVGSDKIILMYSPATFETADVISTYIYRRGILGGDYSYSAAIGLFNSLINFTLLATANFISKKVFETSLW